MLANLKKFYKIYKEASGKTGAFSGGQGQWHKYSKDPVGLNNQKADKFVVTDELLNHFIENGSSVRAVSAVELRITSLKQWQDANLLLRQIKSLSESSNLRIAFKVNHSILLYLDDFLIGLNNSNVDAPVLFYFDSSLLKALKKNRNSWFHFQMFLSKKEKLSSKDPAFYLYYRRLNTFLLYPDDKEVKDSLGKLNRNPYSYTYLSIWDLGRHAIRVKRKTLMIGKVLNNGPQNSSVPNSRVMFESPKDWRRILITGIYGTETQGDKAILGELVHFLNRLVPDAEISITSLNSAISKQSAIEMPELLPIRIVDFHSENLFDSISSYDSVILGGGPIMTSQSLIRIERMFSEARKNCRDTVIFGCGLGPLYESEMLEVAKNLLINSSYAFFRDKESYDLAMNLAPNEFFRYACDPAFNYVFRWRNTAEKEKGFERDARTKIGTLLRENTSQFILGSDKQKLRSQNKQLAAAVSNLLQLFNSKKPSWINLLHMNAPFVGMDDRIFNRQVESELKESNFNSYTMYREYLTLDEHLKILNEMDFALAMRYHGHIFSIALGVPLISIDYTGRKGKVSNLMQSADLLPYKFNWSELESPNMDPVLQELISNRDKMSEYFNRLTLTYVEKLEGVYKELFGLTSE